MESAVQLRTDADLGLEQWFQVIEAPLGYRDTSAIYRLGRFVQGFQLHLPSGAEPYTVLYEKSVARRSQPEVSLVAAGLLDSWLAGEWKPRLPLDGQYNLLQLCLELASGQVLGPQLWELYQRKAVTGEYQGFRPIPLVKVLLGALIRNQVEGLGSDEIWDSAIEGDPDDYLKPTPLDGFVGMLYLPDDLPDDERIHRLAGRLLKLYTLVEEKFSIGALAVMKQVRPDIAIRVLQRAGLDFCEDYEKVLSERIQEAIAETQAKHPEDSFTTDSLRTIGETVSRDTVAALRNDVRQTQWRTLPQVEDLFRSKLMKAVVPLDKPRLTFVKVVRSRTHVRQPISLDAGKMLF